MIPRKGRDAVARYFMLAAAAIASLFPLYWLASISLKTQVDQFAMPPKWFAFKPTLYHYCDAFILRPFAGYLLNSLMVASCSTALALVLGTAAAYGLARSRLPENLSLHIAEWILSTRMFPPIVTAIPLFLIMRALDLINTRAALIITYTAFNLPFVVWMMCGFFRELPAELEESAMIDGESRLGALMRVTIPLVRPGLAATAIFCLIISWNEFLFALILTQTDTVATLPVGISGQVTQYEIRWGPMSAAGVAAIVPILIFAMMAQRHLVRGLSLGAIKG